MRVNLKILFEQKFEKILWYSNGWFIFFEPYFNSQIRLYIFNLVHLNRILSFFPRIPSLTQNFRSDTNFQPDAKFSTWRKISKNFYLMKNFHPDVNLQSDTKFPTRHKFSYLTQIFLPEANFPTWRKISYLTQNSYLTQISSKYFRLKNVESEIPF